MTFHKAGNFYDSTLRLALQKLPGEQDGLQGAGDKEEKGVEDSLPELLFRRSRKPDNQLQEKGGNEDLEENKLTTFLLLNNSDVKV